MWWRTELPSLSSCAILGTTSFSHSIATATLAISSTAAVTVAAAASWKTASSETPADVAATASDAPLLDPAAFSDGDAAVGDSSRWIPSVVFDDVVCDNVALSRGEDLVLANFTFFTALLSSERLKTSVHKGSSEITHVVKPELLHASIKKGYHILQV